MDRRAQITATPRHVPSILVVLDPAWPSLFNLCLSVASACGVLLHRCEAAAAPTFAAERRPLAIILSNNVYALDPPEFDALARDVRAMLLRLDEEVTERELVAMLNGALRGTERRDEGGGRYKFIGEHRHETVGAPRGEGSAPQSVPPPSVRSGSPAARVPATRQSSTPVPASAGPASLRASPPSSRRTPPPPSVRPQPYGAPAAPGSVPPSSRGAPSSSGTSRQAPPSVRGTASPPARPMSASPLPAAQTAPSASPAASGNLPGPPPSSSPSGAPASSRRIPSPPPSSLPVPPSVRGIPGPPSVRTMSQSPSGRTLPPVPVHRSQPPPIRTMTPISTSAAPPSSARTDPSPRSGVRERGSEELDAIFEDQNLPLDALARGNLGNSTPR